MENEKLFPKVKISVRKEALDDFLLRAKVLRLYDSNFPESHQCGGYFKFKELCFGKDPLPTDYEDPYSVIKGLHPNIRPAAVGLAKEFREKYKR